MKHRRERNGLDSWTAIKSLAVATAMAVLMGLSAESEAQLACESGWCTNSDSDTWPDVWDNCQFVTNEDQRDTNNDGVGNVCDPDLDDSGLVTIRDYNVMRMLLNRPDANADLDGNGLVTAADMVILRAYLNLPSGPAAARNMLGGLSLTVNGQTYTCKPGDVLDHINIAANDVTVTDCRIRGGAVPNVNGVTVRAGARNVTLRRLLVERSTATGVYFSGTGTLEDSVVRDPIRRQGIDSWGIYSGAPGLVTVRRTTVYGSGFSIFAEGSVVLEDNRFIVPAEYRTDCNGNIRKDGPCQCAEFGVALKRSTGAAISRNVIEGYRKADPVCGGTGTPGAAISLDGCGGGALRAGCDVKSPVVAGNMISNSHYGVYIGPADTNPRVESNRICSSDIAISDGFGNPSTILDNTFYGNVVNLELYGSRRGPVTGNHLVAGC